ncbi:2414_t:CDS:2 [Cetraspora pellucida]|uniref:2414_t:CDS:1 n=1 Tax=Cetraspora pellucida TaxID=1433469 RepID=A0ACA9JW23_9GLOM|nr:2414_t:CDS:2 [Cetraspora pellucida]
MGKRKTVMWKHWTVLSKNSTKNQDNNQAEDQTEDQAEDQDEDQAEDQIEDHNKPHPCVKCKYCPKIFEHEIATQMQAHLNNTCLGAPENAKSNSKQKNLQSNISIPHISTSLHIPKRLKTIPINNFIDHLDNEKQESLEYMLAQALFATGVLFSFLDNPYVIKFFQRIRPAFKLPNRKKLANELVDKVYEDVKKESDKQILEAQKINHEIYDENREIENIIYTEGICRNIDEIEQIYSSDIDNNSIIELESEYGIINI